MAFLAPAAAAAGTAAASTAIPGMVGATLAAPGVAAMTTGAGAALGTGLAAGAGTAGTIFGATSLGIPGLMGGMGALGGAGSAGSVLGLGGAGLGGAGSALGATGLKAAGTTAALEGAKSSIISTAMQNQAMQNAMMQNMAGGIDSPAAQTVASMGLNPGQQAFLNASTAGGNQLPAQMLGPKPASLVNAQGEIGGVVSTPWNGIQPYQYGNFPAGTPLHAGPVTPTVTTPPVATPTAVPQVAPTGAGNLAETIRNTNTAMRGNLPISYAEGAQGIAPNAFAAPTSGIQPGQNFMQNLGNIGSFQDVKDYVSEHPYASAGMGLGAYQLLKPKQPKPPEQSPGMIRPYTFDYNARPEAYEVSPTADSSERLYFNPVFTAQTPYEAPGPEYAASGGLMGYAVGGPVEQMSAMNSVGANTGYPMANINSPMYSNPMMQRPEATNVIAPSADAGVGAYSGEPRFAEGGEAKTEGGYKYSYDPQTMQFTQLSVPTIVPSRGVIGGAMGMAGTIPYVTPTPQSVKNSGSKISGGIATPAMGPMQAQQASTPTNIPAYQTPEQRLGLGDFYDYMNQQLGGYTGYAAGGNVYDLGGYSDGGRLLKGPGDGVSDSIPASIGNRQPARLADGEFVVPARIVSEIGNGSTEAGARKLYAMMDRVQKARKKSVGKGRVAVNTKADKHLPA